MPRITQSVVVTAPPAVVWSEVERLEDHVAWMADAASIRFDGDRRRGVGTSMIVATRVGPFRLDDHIVVTEWIEGHAIGVRHDGLVTGWGRFTLEADRGGSTRFTWSEHLRFRWWMGGPIGGAVGAGILAAIWRGNLRRLKARVERADPPVRRWRPTRAR